jgi:bacteriorhodopsin
MLTVSSSHDILGAIFARADVLDPLSILELVTSSQFNSVYNVLLLAIIAIFALALVLLNVQAPTCQRYRLALLVSTVVISVAGYHYFRIFNSWDAVYSLQNEVYALTSEPINDIYRYRYTDWLLTVPLLLVESVAVLALPIKESRPLLIKLAAASVAIIAMGYPSEISHSIAIRIIWGTVSTIPFAYILYVLWVELSKSLVCQPNAVQTSVRNTRLLLLFSWGVYPIAYLLTMLGRFDRSAIVDIHLGYTIVDVLAKPMFGLLVLAIALEKTKFDKDMGMPIATIHNTELD